MVFFLQVRLEYTGYCLKVFCLSRLPFIWSLGYREDALLGFFYLLLLELSASPVFILRYMRQKENSEFTNLSFLDIFISTGLEVFLSG